MKPLNCLMTEDQIMIRDLVHDFVEKELRPVIAEHDKNGTFPMDVYKKACAMGINCLDLPTEFGGPGFDYLTSTIIREELAWGDAGFAATLGGNGLGFKTILMAGNDAQIKHYADIVTGGGFLAFALTEPNSGSDAGATATTAKKVGDKYVLNGTKCFISNAGMADAITVLATVDKSLGAKGMTAFMVDRDTPGLTIGKHEDKCGQRLSNTAEVVLQDCAIPVENRIGQEGQGFSVAMRTLDRGRAGCAASATGVARAALEYAVDYANQRVTMGKPIIKHQLVQALLADMSVLVDASRQLAWTAARMIDAGDPLAGRYASEAKFFATDSCMKVCTDAVQVLGGYGYSKEYPVEKLFRDAKVYQIYEGTNQIQRTIVAKALGRE